jgi:hypothetical protein
MSEHEEPQQIGRLAEEYARLKGEVSCIDERIERARRAYLLAAITFDHIVVHEDQLSLGSSDEVAKCSGANLQNLLGTREVVELFSERSRLRAELDGVRSKLRGWLTQV